MDKKRQLTVNQLRRVVDDSLYLAVLLQVTDGNACETAVYFEALDEDALGDEAEGGDLLDDTVEGRLIEGDCVLCLVLDLSLGPLLFLCGLAATGRGGCFSFGLGKKRKKSQKRHPNGDPPIQRIQPNSTTKTV